MGSIKDDIRGSYRGMIDRCYYPKRDSYVRYGGVGIRVCDQWRYSFDNFIKWSLENGYKKGLTIDRIDGSKCYMPSNCRWVTIKEQNINRKSTILITHNGESKPLSYWAKELAIPRQTIKARMDSGLSFEQAINHKLRSKLK